MKHLVFEIGTEELPHSIQIQAEEQMGYFFEQLATEEHIPFKAYEVFVSCRRITLLVEGIPERLEGREEFILGPRTKIAFCNGEATEVAKGFARKHGVGTESLKIVKAEDGERVAVVKKIAPAQTKDVLRRVLPSLLKKLSFSKTMVWEESFFSFPRPIRWLLALFGEEIIDFGVADVFVQRFSMGHRVYGGKVYIKDADSYKEALKCAKVIVSQKERRQIIESKIEEVASSLSLSARVDEDILEEIVSQLEWPIVLCAKYPPSSLPEEVIKECIKASGFIPLYKDGVLSEYFLFTSNVDDKEGFIREGNERVLSARLEDAQFYMRQDRKKEFKKRVEELKGVVWIEGLGTLYDKSTRLVKLCKHIEECIDERVPYLEEAALYSKCDLCTELVAEYPQLQGKASLFYAEDLKDEVKDAISSHYMPYTFDEPIPKSLAACVLSIADRVDTLCGSFIAGTVPKGSSDPYGIRRITNGLLKIFFENEKIGKKIKMEELVKMCVRNFSKGERVLDKILDFVHTRAKIVLSQNFPQDYVECLMRERIPNLWKVKRKLSALYRNADIVKKVAIIYKRLFNITGRERIEGKVDESLFLKEEEKVLHRVYEEVKEKYHERVKEEDWDGALKALSIFFEPLHSFFENVMVMVEEEDLRRNRLCLLSSIKELVEEFGDFLQIKVQV